MKVVVVGRGFGERVVAPVFAQTAGCEVVDVVSARDERAVAAAIARPDVDLVTLHSPPFLHAPHVRLALAAGKAVLCDKPFALDRVRTGELGRVEHVQLTRLSAGSRVPLRPWGWLFDRALGGGWIGAWGSHAIDSLRWMFGSEVAEVQALLRIDVPARPDAGGESHACTAEDGFSASLVLESGATVAIDSGFAAAGTRDTIDLSDVDEADGHLAPMRAFAAVVRDAVTTREIVPGTPTFADGRACDAVLDRLRAAPFAPGNSGDD